MNENNKFPLPLLKERDTGELDGISDIIHNIFIYSFFHCLESCWRIYMIVPDRFPTLIGQSLLYNKGKELNVQILHQPILIMV